MNITYYGIGLLGLSPVQWGLHVIHYVVTGSMKACFETYPVFPTYDSHLKVCSPPLIHITGPTDHIKIGTSVPPKKESLKMCVSGTPTDLVPYYEEGPVGPSLGALST
jgi:hypothetical protein